MSFAPYPGDRPHGHPRLRRVKPRHQDRVRSWVLTCTLTGGVFALLMVVLVASRGLQEPPASARAEPPCRLKPAARPCGAESSLRPPHGVETVSYSSEVTILRPAADYHPDIYLINDARRIEPGRYGGVDDLITLMGISGLKWHRSSESSLTSGPGGLIDADDVVLIKINAQWPERGGTNTDVLRGVIRRVVEHPDGFIGEVVVADNGQGSGNLDRTEHNAEDPHQSPQDVVNDFADELWNVSTYLWDEIRAIPAVEYSPEDLESGYIVNPVRDPQTGIKVSYPKFETDGGAYVSYKYGIWSPATQTYDHGKLVVINIPVFKVHQAYGITAGLKNHMGVVTAWSFDTRSHNAVGEGGLGSLLAEVRMPDLTILDCIWIHARPGEGPGCAYVHASRRDQLVAGVDPLAVDMWATKFIMVPQVIERGYTYEDYGHWLDPDNPRSEFRIYLDLSMNEMLVAGIKTTNDLGAINLHVWAGDVDRDGDVDLGDIAGVQLCFGQEPISPECWIFDLDDSGDIDLTDFAGFQAVLTGPTEPPAP